MIVLVRLPGVDEAEERSWWKDAAPRRRVVAGLALLAEFLVLAWLGATFVVRPESTGEQIAY